MRLGTCIARVSGEMRLVRLRTVGFGGKYVGTCIYMYIGVAKVSGEGLSLCRGTGGCDCPIWEVGVARVSGEIGECPIIGNRCS